MNVLIIHGSYGSPDINWFPWLKIELEKLGHRVFIPKFPTPEGQSLGNWTRFIEEQNIPFDDDLIIVAHSIGPSFALSLLESHKCRACFFVAGFVSLLGGEYDKVNKTFVTHKFDWRLIKKNCPLFVLYHGDNDPYVPMKYASELADKLEVKLNIIKNGGHLNTEWHYTKFPLLLEDIKKVIR